MLYYSVPPSLLVVAVTAVILIITKTVGGASTQYFVKQQTSLGNINGYIEEMLGGQKVIKVFCYERQAEEEFVDKNDQLYQDAKKANRYANVLMPILGQIVYNSKFRCHYGVGSWTHY